MSSTQIIDLIFTNWSKYGLHKVGIEDNQFTQGLKLSWEEQSRTRGVYPDIVLTKHHGIQKELRIESLVPRYERGGIYHLTIGGENQCSDLEDELALFPKATNDDASDSLAYQNDEEMQGGVQGRAATFTGGDSVTGYGAHAKGYKQQVHHGYRR